MPIMNPIDQKKERLKRLKKALDDVKAMNGSPDIINSILKAIEQEQLLDDYYS